MSKYWCTTSASLSKLHLAEPSGSVVTNFSKAPGISVAMNVGVAWPPVTCDLRTFC